MYPDLPLNEKQILQQIAEGSEDAFRILFNSYRRRLYNYILRTSSSKETAEDTVHDVFLKIWENREKLTQVDNINAYLYRMAHNHAYTGFQRMAKETLILAALQKDQDTGSGLEGEDRLVHKEVRDFIQNAVNKLTPQQKLVFLMSRNEGLKHEEIAQKLHISIFTVKNHVADALRFLREEVGRSYGSKAVALYVLYNLAAN